MIDFKKPIRFAETKGPAHFVGPRLDGRFVIEEVDGNPLIFSVDENGFVPLWRAETPLIENIPERITRWVVMTPHIGYENKEEAINVAAHYEGEHCAVIRVEFEEGERP